MFRMPRELKGTPDVGFISEPTHASVTTSHIVQHYLHLRLKLPCVFPFIVHIRIEVKNAPFLLPKKISQPSSASESLV